MMFAYLVIIALVLLFVALMLRKYTRLDFVPHVKSLWRAWSVRLSTLAILVQAFAEQFPQHALNAWNALPPDIKSLLPPDWLHYISMGLVILALFAQPFLQPKMRRDHGDNSDPAGQ